MERIITCIICPRSCRITADGTEISNYGCKRGLEYASNEITNPVRTLTSTVRTEDGRILPVKTTKPVPKSSLFDCMKVLKQTNASQNASVGDIIIKNICGLDADIIVTGG